jgi:hypothetical protein
MVNVVLPEGWKMLNYTQQDIARSVVDIGSGALVDSGQRFPC